MTTFFTTFSIVLGNIKTVSYWTFSVYVFFGNCEMCVYLNIIYDIFRTITITINLTFNNYFNVSRSTMTNVEDISYNNFDPDDNYFNYVFNSNSNVEVLKCYSIINFHNLWGNNHDYKLFIMGYNIKALMRISINFRLCFLMKEAFLTSWSWLKHGSRDRRNQHTLWTNLCCLRFR